MSTGIRVWLVCVAGLIGIVALTAAAMLVADGEPEAQPPRDRTSVPGLEVDVFADESEVAGTEAVGEVTVYDGIEQLRAAFTADAGHPRLVLLVDPL